MTEIILNEAQVEAAVGKIKAAGMTQHMRMHRCKPGTLRSDREEIVDRLTGERMSALREEQPRQGIRAKRQIAPDGVAAEQAGVGPVVLIDTDPHRLAELRAGGVALVLIDTPPAITSAIREVMRVADLVVMPVRPSPHDLDAVGATIDLAQAADVPFVFAVTQAKLNARVTPQAVALLSSHGTVAPSIIQDRVIYATAMTDGRTASDIEPKGAAAAEISGLWDFVRGRLDDRQIGVKERRQKVA